mmetsp:Transcript_19244/g.41831  ORF Transcript_19244/g.41831 Transcript_19244/m.41831 type:complete len:230 (+) Transcript_19244:196-885(+)|eukprot:CAMPEP_0168187874 /NCGR_PEP_ID=MMETSP0139_2-20121125/15292_1 /TAXON_ID=44445 /ORGANISM="Pseudo-nitzschia australis, Strain 10249 10 AB" /LENGTH=229 /DNA_ID=CAMNT_0008110165 /DNA_START=175 /DNA_END=864 /DNA_ORIENTATION=+
MRAKFFTIVLGFVAPAALAWIPARSTGTVSSTKNNQHIFRLQSSVGSDSIGSLHGENSCFMPLRQLDQDYYAPRIVQIAGAYPGLTREEFFAVTSEKTPEPGQWTYDFSDPDGPQLGTVAIESSNVVACCEDPVAIIAEHTSLSVPLPEVLKEPVDIIVLVDRAATSFAERKFLLLDVPGKGLVIGAFPFKTELPNEAEILGHVLLCQLPWLPCMKPTKTGFMEADEYF